MMNEKLKHINKVIKLVNYAYEESYQYELDFYNPSTQQMVKHKFAKQVCDEMGASRSPLDNTTPLALLGLLHMSHGGLREPTSPIWLTRTVRNDVLIGMEVRTNNNKLKLENTFICEFILKSEKIVFNNNKFIKDKHRNYLNL